MKSALSKFTAITAISALGILGLSACSSATDSGADSSSAGMSQLVGPVVVDVAAIDGTEVMVTAGQMIDITTGDLDPTMFTATVANSDVATFTAGGTAGSATSNPGITGVAAGTTNVVLTDSATGAEYNFIVTVN
jgi:hypothetical protein